MDTALLGTEDYVNWQRKVPVKPDGSTGWCDRAAVQHARFPAFPLRSNAGYGLYVPV